jgi:hypothetical protein
MAIKAVAVAAKVRSFVNETFFHSDMKLDHICGQYYKHNTVVNDTSTVISE